MSEMPIVGRIVRDSQNECLIKKGKYWNIDVIDVRWHGENGKPTRKGIRLNVEEDKILIDILRRELE